MLMCVFCVVLVPGMRARVVARLQRRVWLFCHTDTQCRPINVWRRTSPRMASAISTSTSSVPIWSGLPRIHRCDCCCQTGCTTRPALDGAVSSHISVNVSLSLLSLSLFLSLSLSLSCPTVFASSKPHTGLPAGSVVCPRNHCHVLADFHSVLFCYVSSISRAHVSSVLTGAHRRCCSTAHWHTR